MTTRYIDGDYRPLVENTDGIEPESLLGSTADGEVMLRRSGSISWNTITEENIDDDAVTEGKIQNAAVSRSKLASDATPPSRSTATPAGVSDTASAGTATDYASGDHRHELDPGFELLPRNLPETLQILEHEYSSGGLRLLTDGSIQIAGDLQGSALGIIDTGQTWGGEVTRTQDTSLGANPWIQMRFRITDFAALPAVSALGDYRIATDASGDPDVPTPMGPIMTLVSRAAPTDDTSNTYHYAYAQIQIANWPAGDYVRLLHNTPSGWSTPVSPSQITGGTMGQVMTRGSTGAEWAAAVGGGALNGSVSELTWTGNTNIPAATAQATEGAWGDLQTLSLEAGDNVIWFDLLDNRQPSTQIAAWGSADFQIRRTRGAVTSTAWETVDYKINTRGVTGGHIIAFRFVAFVEDAQAGDTYTLRGRVRADNVTNMGSMTFNAVDQRVYVLNMTEPAGTGMQLTRPTGNELQDHVVDRRNLALPLLAEVSPTVRLMFASGVGTPLFIMGSPAQGDAVNNNIPGSSYQPQDVAPRTLPLMYDRSGQTTHTDRLGYVLSFGADTERINDPRFGAGGTVDNELRYGLPNLINNASMFINTEIIPYGSGGQPIWSLPTNQAGTTSWTMWHNATTGRLHIAEADGTEYGAYTPPAGAGLRGRRISTSFQVDKTATGYQFAWQVNGVNVPMSNPATNPALERLSWGYFPGTRYDGQMTAVGVVLSMNEPLGIPAGTTGGGHTLVSPFGIRMWQYSVNLNADFEYGRPWSENLISTDITLLNTNETHVALDRTFDMSEMSEIRVDLQHYASERGSSHAYLEGLTTRTAAATNSALVGTWAVEWERGKPPTSYFRGALNGSTTLAQWAAYIYPLVNGDIVSELSVRNAINNGDTAVVQGVYIR